ncbi:MAG: ABC transporter substrate-binding protein, partial [Bdellovibrionales bacterium]|nr:ABC transporter substrate-binding protein [Bdellovibrionales bacterium]
MKSLFYIVILFAFLSCSIKPEKKPPVAPSPNLSNEFKKASLDQKKKRYSQAVKRYKLIIEKAPNSDLADDAHIEIGNIYFQKKMFDAAYESFISVVNAQTYSPREAFAMFMAARCLTEKGRYNEALSLTDRASRHETFSSKDILELKRLRLFLYHQLGDPIDELASISELLEHETNENLKKSYRIQGEAIVSHQLPYDSIKKVASASRYGVFSSVAEFELGKLEYKQGDFSSARSYLKDSLSGLTSSSQILEAQQMLTNIDARRRVDPQTIGVILPLSGKHATVAERTLRGLQLGLGVFGSDRSNYSLAVLDSNSNPDQAAEAVERLVVEDNVIAIVGSLLSKT